MEFQHEIFPQEIQHAYAQEMQAVLCSYLDGEYQDLSFAIRDLIVRLCKKNQVTLKVQAAIRLNNSLSALIERWREEELVDGGRPMQQKMQSLIAQLLPLVVQAIPPGVLVENGQEIPPHLDHSDTQSNSSGQ